MRRMLRVLFGAALVLAIPTTWGGGEPEPAPKGMASAASAWLATLDDEQRGRALLSWDGAERKNWHYVPKQRKGLRIEEMTPAQRLAAHDLLRSALSSRGYLKATTIISLEAVLRRIEQARGRRATHRNPELFTFAVFGEPSGKKPWGWRVEGHHLSLNFSSVTGEWVATTPTFFGANPATVPDGPEAGLRVLADEEDLARRLLESMTPAQRERAVIADRAPRDILLGPGRKADLKERSGLPVASMNDSQKQLLWRLIEEYAENLRHDLAESRLQRIREAGLDGVHFAWAGDARPGKPHYYRIHGPTFVVEYDNMHPDPGHIHTVWRDPAGDFGEDLLRRHLEKHGHKL